MSTKIEKNENLLSLYILIQTKIGPAQPSYEYKLYMVLNFLLLQ